MLFIMYVTHFAYTCERKESYRTMLNYVLNYVFEVPSCITPYVCLQLFTDNFMSIDIEVTWQSTCKIN